MSARRDSGNLMRERLLMWMLSTLGRICNDSGLYGSPSLAMIGLRPSLRWVWSGASAHARRVHEDPGAGFLRGFNEGMYIARREAWSEYDRLVAISDTVDARGGSREESRAAVDVFTAQGDYAESLGPRPRKVAP